MAEVNREVVESQKKSLEAQYQQGLANLNAIKGALELCEHFLNTLNKEESKNDEGKVGQEGPVR